MSHKSQRFLAQWDQVLSELKQLIDHPDPTIAGDADVRELAVLLGRLKAAAAVRDERTARAALLGQRLGILLTRFYFGHAYVVPLGIEKLIARHRRQRSIAQVNARRTAAAQERHGQLLAEILRLRSAGHKVRQSVEQAAESARVSVETAWRIWRRHKPHK